MKPLLPAMLLVITTACTSYNEEELYGKNKMPCTIENVSYLTDVKPILQRECSSCHTTGFASGEVALDTYSGVKAHVDKGRLFGAITHAPGFSPMPKGGNKLPDCDIAKIKKWIDTGASDN